MFAYLHRILPCYYALLSILLGLSLAWTFSSVTALYLDSGQAVTRTIEPQHLQPKSSIPADNKVILQRNIFNSANVPTDTATPKPPTSTSHPKDDSSVEDGERNLLTDTDLAGRPLKKAANMELIGTIAGQIEAIAVINIDGKIDIYRLGELIGSSSRIVKIERLQVYIENTDGSVSILELTTQPTSRSSSTGSPFRTVGNGSVKSQGVVQLNDTSWRISTERAEQIRGNIANIVRQARVEPVVNQGQTQGFVVKYIQPGTLLTEMGIMRGDVIKRVNDTTLDSPEKGLQIFQQLREAKTMNLNIERNNTPMTFSYEIR